MKNESCRAITNSAAFILKIFLASTGRVAVTEGGDLGGLGVIPQQAFWPVQSGQNRKTCICLHCLRVTFFVLIFYIQVVTIQCFCGTVPQTGLKWNNLLFGQPVLLSALYMPADTLPGSFAVAEYTR